MLHRIVVGRQDDVADGARVYCGHPAVAAGCGEGGRKRLYVNARHLGGEEALAIAHEFQGAAIFRLQVTLTLA